MKICFHVGKRKKVKKETFDRNSTVQRATRSPYFSKYRSRYMFTTHTNHKNYNCDRGDVLSQRSRISTGGASRTGEISLKTKTKGEKKKRRVINASIPAIKSNRREREGERGGKGKERQKMRKSTAGRKPV